MASLNQVQLIGNLGRDPEVRYMADGGAACSFSVGCNETWKDKNGDKKEKVEWVRCTAFGKLAEICGEYLKKGSSVFIQGRLQTRKFQDKDGQDKYITEVILDRMQMLGAKSATPDREEKRETRPDKPGKTEKFDDMDSDIPF